jgi:hypothetical protein
LGKRESGEEVIWKAATNPILFPAVINPHGTSLI